MRRDLIKKFVAAGKGLRRAQPMVVKFIQGDEAKVQAEKMSIDVPSSGRLFKYVISDQTEDRHGDTINPDGWDLKTFQRSGAVLWAHQHTEPPVQTAIKTWVENGQLLSIAKEFEKGINPFADMISEMVAREYIKMNSVGFLPFEYEVRKGQEDEWWPSIDFEKQELTEYSIVPSGSNRNAFLEDMPEHEEALKQFVVEVMDGAKQVNEEVLKDIQEVHEEKYKSDFYLIDANEVADKLKNLFDKG